MVIFPCMHLIVGVCFFIQSSNVCLILKAMFSVVTVSPMHSSSVSHSGNILCGFSTRVCNYNSHFTCLLLWLVCMYVPSCADSCDPCCSEDCVRFHQCGLALFCYLVKVTAPSLSPFPFLGTPISVVLSFETITDSGAHA